jgi:hypothetical protein
LPFAKRPRPSRRFRSLPATGEGYKYRPVCPLLAMKLA